MTKKWSSTKSGDGQTKRQASKAKRRKLKKVDPDYIDAGGRSFNKTFKGAQPYEQ